MSHYIHTVSSVLIATTVNSKTFNNKFTCNCTVHYNIIATPQTNVCQYYQNQTLMVVHTALCACVRILSQMSFVFQSQHIAHVVCLVSYPVVVDVDYQE